MSTIQTHPKPTKAFRFAAIGALLIGTIAYCVGLFNANMLLNEKGYYLVLILFGLFAAVSVQKSVRDKAEGIKTSKIYFVLGWLAVSSAIVLLSIGLINADLLLSEKGFFGMAYTLSLFASIAVQKNVRDMQAIEPQSKDQAKESASPKSNDERPNKQKLEYTQATENALGN